MKTSILVFIGISLSVLSANAQDDRSVRNDVTYSVNNYKHANKAAAARRWTTNKGLEVTPPSATNQLANYKRQLPGLPPAGGIVLPHTPQTDVALRNYKIQRISHQAAEPTQTASEKLQTKVPSVGNE